MNVAAAFNLFNLMLGEPSDTANQRWGQANFVTLYNEARRWLAESTRSFEIRDSQETIPGTNFYSLQNDVIAFYSVEWDGIPLDVVRPEDWRDRIGDDESLQGEPYVYKHHARRLQLFYTPQSAKTLRYEGWGYPQDIVVNGADTDLTDAQARAAVYRAVVIAKTADDRDASGDERMMVQIAEELRRQYHRKGPRYVRRIQGGRSVIGRILNG